MKNFDFKNRKEFIKKLKFLDYNSFIMCAKFY